MRSAFEACRAQRVSFIPLPVETLGGWHPEAEKQISRIGRELARSSLGTDQKTASNHLFQRLSLSLQKGNAALLLSRSTDVQQPDILGHFYGIVEHKSLRYELRYRATRSYYFSVSDSTRFLFQNETNIQSQGKDN